MGVSAIVRNCLWYGIFDQHSFRNDATPLFRGGLQFALDAYRSDGARFGGNICLLDLKDSIRAFPPTLFITALRDPLGLCKSSALASDFLKTIGVQVKISAFDENHGFVAYPPQIQKWMFGVDVQKGAIAANAVIQNFLHRGFRKGD